MTAIIKDHQPELEQKLREQGMEFERFEVSKDPGNGGRREGGMAQQQDTARHMNQHRQNPSNEANQNRQQPAQDVEQHPDAVQGDEPDSREAEQGAPLNITI